MPRPLRLLAPFIAIVSIAGAFTPRGTTRAGDYALTHVTIIDGTGRAPQPDMTIVVRGTRITDVFPSGRNTLPAGVTADDAGGRFVIPGLIDSHVHLGTLRRDSGMMAGALRTTFMDGLTTVRDMGGSDSIVIPLARVARSDTVPMPRVYYSAIMAGSGRWFEGDFARITAGTHPIGTSPLVRRVDASTDVPRVIAEAKAQGASAIKMYNDIPPALVRRLVAEAHRQGLLAWSHLSVDPTLPSELIAAGVDAVSHGDQFRAEIATIPYRTGETPPQREARQQSYAALSPNDPKLTALLTTMRDRGVAFDPTLTIMLPPASYADSTPAVRDASLRAFRFAAAMTRRAVAMGVPVVAGTDGIGGSSANLHGELQHLVDSAGLTPLQAIRAATSAGARVLRIADSVGTIAPGMRADMVVLRGDPSRDIRNTQTIAAVVKAGTLFRRTTPQRIGPHAKAPPPGL